MNINRIMTALVLMLGFTQAISLRAEDFDNNILKPMGVEPSVSSVRNNSENYRIMLMGKTFLDKDVNLEVAPGDYLGSEELAGIDLGAGLTVRVIGEIMAIVAAEGTIKSDASGISVSGDNISKNFEGSVQNLDIFIDSEGKIAVEEAFELY